MSHVTHKRVMSHDHVTYVNEVNLNVALRMRNTSMRRTHEARHLLDTSECNTVRHATYVLQYMRSRSTLMSL